MTDERLNQLISSFAQRRIAVLGDYFLDKYIEFDPALAEISLETGKTANQVVSVRHSPGAAGNIVCNLASLGASVVPVGFTGDDGEGYELKQDLTRLGCNLEHLFCVPERSTPVYLKPRDVTVKGIEGEHGRYDTKNHSKLPEHVEQQIIDALSEVLSHVDAMIIVDQVDKADCGVVTTRVRQTLENIAAEYPEVIFWVDSRERVGFFKNCILKPNQFEALSGAFPGTCADMDFSKVTEAGHILSDRSGKPVFLTAAERGILVFKDGSYEEVRGIRIDGPIDPTGAGDSVTSGAVMALASGASLVEAALIANMVASLTVCQIDTTGTASLCDLPGRLEQWHNFAAH